MMSYPSMPRCSTHVGLPRIAQGEKSKFNYLNCLRCCQNLKTYFKTLCVVELIDVYINFILLFYFILF